MSLSAISAAASTALPALNFHAHGHHKGAHFDSQSASSATSSSKGGSIGQLPVGASTSLFSNLIQSLQQTIGAQSSSASAAAAPAPAVPAVQGATGTAAAANAQSPGRQQELQAFTHSLFQSLKQDGLGSSSGSSAVSSLQTLVHLLGSGQPASAANRTLNSTFQNLVNGSSSGSAGASASAGTSDPSSTTALQSFLNNLLQNLQSGGTLSLNGVGNSLNAKV
jgi:hypothetical protein